jgi:hypothetical protein
MKQLYILEARWHDKINRVRRDSIVGVYDDLLKLEKAKKEVEKLPHEYASISFSIKSEIQPFHA